MDSTEQVRTIRHGGGVKLLLRCLQSIQCQYYLVFGVVKTVPLQSFARLRASVPPPLLSSLSQKSRRGIFFFCDPNGSTTTWRTVIDTYILHLLSLRSFLIIYIARARARFTLIRLVFFTLSSSPLLLPQRQESDKSPTNWIKSISIAQQLRNKSLHVIGVFSTFSTCKSLAFFIATHSVITPSDFIRR